MALPPTQSHIQCIPVQGKPHLPPRFNTRRLSPPTTPTSSHTLRRRFPYAEINVSPCRWVPQLQPLCLLHPPMSCLFVQGFFALTSGRRAVVERVVNENTVKSNYILYQTAIQCTSEVSYAAELRVFATSHSAMLPNNSVIHLIAKVDIDIGRKALLEAMAFSVIPGDASAENYEDHIPDERFPYFFVLGQVMKEIPLDTKTTAYAIMTTDYVRDGPSQSMIHCCIDRNAKRWAKTPSPRPNSIVLMFGVASNVVNGYLQIAVQSLAFNVGQPLTSAGVHRDIPAAAASPAKRRKFSAVATIHEEPIASSSKTPTVVESTDVFMSVEDVTGGDTTCRNNVVNNDDALPAMEKKGKGKASK